MPLSYLFTEAVFVECIRVMPIFKGKLRSQEDNTLKRRIGRIPLSLFALNIFLFAFSLLKWEIGIEFLSKQKKKVGGM